MLEQLPGSDGAEKKTDMCKEDEQSHGKEDDGNDRADDGACEGEEEEKLLEGEEEEDAEDAEDPEDID